MFICTNNSARSQMAEGLLRALYGERYEAYSAGTEPSEVRRHAIGVMAEIGIDISRQRAKSVDEFLDREFDCVVTVCDQAKETCPFFPAGKVILHQSFEDPPHLASEEEELARFREVRDQIRAWIKQTFEPHGRRASKAG